jgi:hypothetical protein
MTRIVSARLTVTRSLHGGREGRSNVALWRFGTVSGLRLHSVSAKPHARLAAARFLAPPLLWRIPKRLQCEGLAVALQCSK